MQYIKVTQRIFQEWNNTKTININMKQLYHVTCSTDDNYVQHCVAMLCSLFDNNKDKTFAVHLLVGQLSEISKNTINNLCKKYNNELNIYIITNSIISNLSLNDATLDGKPTYSIATYYRILLPSQINNNIDKNITLPIVAQIL